ncbi:hypothetical protein EMIT013CA1_20350 [Bacillus sp. IT-13CA1]
MLVAFYVFSCRYALSFVEMLWQYTESISFLYRYINLKILRINTRGA